MSASSVSGGEPFVEGARLVLDGDRVILESNVPELPVGVRLVESSWLGATLLDVVATAELGGAVARGAGRDCRKGAHWLVSATTTKSPWRTHLRLLDATLAVEADRLAIFSKLVHRMQNVSFALLSVLQVMESEPPAGEELGECVREMKDPAARFSVVMARLAACINARRVSPRAMRVDALAAHAIPRVAPLRSPVGVKVDEAVSGQLVSADADAVAEIVAAMLETERGPPDAAVEVDSARIDGRDHVRIAVVRRASRDEERGAADLWDLASPSGLEVPLRLHAARAAVHAHGGEVFAENAEPGRVRLVAHLPLLTA